MRTINRGTSNDQRRQSNEETTIKPHFFFFFTAREWTKGRSVGDLTKRQEEKEWKKEYFSLGGTSRGRREGNLKSHTRGCVFRSAHYSFHYDIIISKKIDSIHEAVYN
jgi:hypothetical protein